VTERTEKRMVAREQGESIMGTGTAITQEWDAAWESDGESKEEGSESRNRMSLDEERQANEVFSKSSSSFTNQCRKSLLTFSSTVPGRGR
jgi:centromere/kinetochore protein ZW10